jgi:predicted nucleotide-binding protein (sugar kinase/HSP70/actin superfamily)
VEEAEITVNRIGIPRALMYYRFFPLWSAFFRELGFEVVTSDPGERGLLARQSIGYFEDSCFPMKLMVSHCMELSERVDVLFAPRLISIHRKYIMCPKFRGVPDIARLATGGRVELIDDLLDCRLGSDPWGGFSQAIGERLGFGPREIRAASRQALQVQRGFEGDLAKRVNELPTRDIFALEVPTPEAPSPPGDLTIAIIGHPYNIYDVDVGKDVLGMAKKLGCRIAIADSIDGHEMERCVSSLSKDIYWSSGREIVGAALAFLAREDIDGVVFLSSFKCGIDALLQEYLKRVFKARGGRTIPFMTTSLDEHTTVQGLATRMEAFVDICGQKRAQTGGIGRERCT